MLHEVLLEIDASAQEVYLQSKDLQAVAEEMKSRMTLQRHGYEMDGEIKKWEQIGDVAAIKEQIAWRKSALEKLMVKDSAISCCSACNVFCLLASCSVVLQLLSNQSAVHRMQMAALHVLVLKEVHWRTFHWCRSLQPRL